MLRILTLCLLLVSLNTWAGLSYKVKQVDELPLIDGSGNDEIWAQAATLTVMDVIANHELYFSALHNGESIAIKVHFPDATENREHKTLIWEETTSSYKTGPKREDTLVLKWAMNSFFKNLTLRSNEPYQADIWYWKSFRTDPTGYADDKYQIYSRVPKNKAKRLRSKDGSQFFLQRKGDSGTSSYKARILLDKQSTEEAKYKHRQPDGSRADIKARGSWHEGKWTVEFIRKLDTGHNDDVRLVSGKKIFLGLSRYEIAGRKPDKQLQEAFFGAGEVGELIELKLDK